MSPGAMMMLSREVRRVPLDFDAPIGETWKGYISPSWRPCPSEDCEHGYTLARAWANKIVFLLLMLAEAPEDERGKNLHPWLAALPLSPKRRPLANARELTAGLAGREPSSFGHDALDNYAATKAIIAAAGLDPETWGVCPVCEGDAIHPDDRASAEAWEPTDPPAGDAWQMWETVSEGGPISPPFPTPLELAKWLAENKGLPGREKMTVEEWLAVIDAQVIGVSIGDGTLIASQEDEQ